MANRLQKLSVSAVGILLTLPLLSGCGFTPLYADSDQSLTRTLAQVNIQPIRQPELASYVLQNKLRDFASSNAIPRYDLSVGLDEKRRSVAVTSEAQTARFEYTLRARYTLTDNDTGKRYRNDKSVVTSYGIVPSQYASFVGEEDAIRKASVELAQQIETDLVFYFRGQVEGDEVDAGEEFSEPTEIETLREKQLEEILGEDFDSD